MDDGAEIRTNNYLTNEEAENRQNLERLFKESPIPASERLENLALFIKRQDLSRVLFLHHLYNQILNVNGVVIDFGVRWGQDMALFEAFRGIYEPFNYTRKIIGFDTFEGFPSVHEKDGDADIAREGAFSVTENYEKYLEQILTAHENESPISHIKKHQLIKGDATIEVEKYFSERPETIVALAYFDFDLYEPTKKCLEVISKHITKGSVIGFDELNHHDFPGETLAFKEVFGLDKYQIRRLPIDSVPSYIVIE